MVSLLHSLRRFGRADAGNVAMLTGLMSTMFVGVAGLSVDVGSWYVTERAMQSAADAAAIGGMTELMWGRGADAARSTARSDAATNGFAVANGSTVDVVVAGTPQSVTVTVTRPGERYLSGLFLANAPILSATARAVVTSGGPVCLLATAPVADASLTSPGTGRILAPTCALIANSTSTEAIAVRTGEMIGSTICGPGGWTIGNGHVSPLPSHCPAMADPLADHPAPANANAPCQHTNFKVNSTDTLSPGVYCGGITVNGNATATFQPGIYILRDGGLDALGNAVLTGTGVSFYLTGSGTAVQLAKDDVTLTGDVTVNFSAPASGPMAGILIYQDLQAAPDGTVTNTITGNDKTNFTGTLYFGNQNLTVTGNGTANGTAPFTAIIANKVTFTGSGTLRLATDFGGSSVPSPGLLLSRVALSL